MSHLTILLSIISQQAMQAGEFGHPIGSPSETSTFKLGGICFSLSTMHFNDHTLLSLVSPSTVLTAPPFTSGTVVAACGRWCTILVDDGSWLVEEEEEEDVEGRTVIGEGAEAKPEEK